MKLKNILFIAVALFTSCSNGNLEKRVEVLKDSVSLLEQQVAEMTTELDGYRYSPENLCANAQTLYDAEKEVELKDIQSKLEKYHPAAPQLETIKGYIASIESKREARAAAEKAKRMQAVTILSKKYDDVRNITWYDSKKSKKSGTFTRIYIGKDKTGHVWLRLRMQYAGEDWIFFEQAYLSYDGNTHQVVFDKYREADRDNGYGGVWEWLDVEVDSSMLSFLRRMANGNTLKCRLSGRYTKTWTMSANEKAALNEILLAYDVLKKGE